MDEKLTQELLDEFLPTLEVLDTENTAILQFLKDKGIADEEQLAPYLEQAAKASDVKWRATRLRLNHLISSAAKAAERTTQKESEKIQTKSEKADKESAAPNEEVLVKKTGANTKENKGKSAESKSTAPTAEKTEDQTANDANIKQRDKETVMAPGTDQHSDNEKKGESGKKTNQDAA
jgi:hypothetical protein